MTLRFIALFNILFPRREYLLDEFILLKLMTLGFIALFNILFPRREYLLDENETRKFDQNTVS